MSSSIPTASSDFNRNPSRLLTVETLAKAKCLPLDFLGSLGWHDLPNNRIGIPYRDQDSTRLFDRIRTNGIGVARFYQPRDRPCVPYGLDHLGDVGEDGHIVLVEGETDCVALWAARLAVLGIPGVNAVGCLQAEHLRGIRRVYISHETDTAGDTFVEKMIRRLCELRFNGEALELKMPEGCKDPCDLRVRAPERFPRAFAECLKAAVPLLPKDGRGNASRSSSPSGPGPAAVGCNGQASLGFGAGDGADEPPQPDVTVNPTISVQRPQSEPLPIKEIITETLEDIKKRNETKGAAGPTSGEPSGGVPAAGAGPGRAGQEAAPPAAGADQGGDGEEEPPPPRGATLIAQLVHNAGVELFKDRANKAYAYVPFGSHWRTLAVEGGEFKDWVSNLYFESEGAPVSSHSLNEAVQHFAAQARLRGTRHRVFLRVGEHGGRRYLDLADDQGRVIEIGPDGWKLCEKPPVRFRRERGQLPLPMPEKGGAIEDLRPYVNLANEADFRLVIGWLTWSLQPGPLLPPLGLSGEENAGKSTVAMTLRTLIDPHEAASCSKSRDITELFVLANACWVVALDNLSDMPGWLSDALCLLASGAAHVRRALYSNDGLSIISLARPVIFNAIEEIATRPDLLSRCILLELHAMSGEVRINDEDLAELFRQAHPRLLGALLDVVAGALNNHPGLRAKADTRLKGFLAWSEAVGRYMRWAEGQVAKDLAQSAQRAQSIVAEATPWLEPLEQLLDQKDGEWQGTATALLNELKRVAGVEASNPRGWPTLGHFLSGRLRRASRSLLQRGIKAEFGEREGKGGTRLIRLSAVSPETSP